MSAPSVLTALDRTRPRAAAAEVTASVGAQALLAADPATVCWLTGYVTPFEAGPSPFAPANPICLLALDGVATLLVSSDADTADVDPDVRIVTYEGYAFEDMRPADALLAGLAQAVRPEGQLAGETAYLPLCATAITDQPITDVTPQLQRSRAVKSPGEIAALRTSIAVAEAGLAAAAEAVAPGMTELELFALVRSAMESRAGSRLDLWADCVSGPRTVAAEGGPSDRVLGADDVVILDLVPRVHGYWGDSATTFALGDAEPEVTRRLAVVREALGRCVAEIRPDVPASHVDDVARAVVRGHGFDYAHHTGHGLGTAYHERPRITPASTDVLAPGMVLALEVGANDERLGCRLEVVVAVSEDGYELLAEPKDIPGIEGHP